MPILCSCAWRETLLSLYNVSSLSANDMALVRTGFAATAALTAAGVIALL